MPLNVQTVLSSKSHLDPNEESQKKLPGSTSSTHPRGTLMYVSPRGYAEQYFGNDEKFLKTHKKEMNRENKFKNKWTRYVPKWIEVKQSERKKQVIKQLVRVPTFL